MTGPERDPGAQEHGNVFGRGWGNMFIHVQRETGLAHRTMVLRPWQVQALRLVASKWFVAVVTVAIVSWAYFAFQTARVPFLTRRITHLEQDAAKIDTLQATLEQLQRRYTQVQQMLSASARSTPAAPAKETKPAETPRKAPVNGPVQNSAKAPAKTAVKTPLALIHHGAHGERLRATEDCKTRVNDVAPCSACVARAVPPRRCSPPWPSVSSVRSVVEKACVTTMEALSPRSTRRTAEGHGVRQRLWLRTSRHAAHGEASAVPQEGVFLRGPPLFLCALRGTERQRGGPVDQATPTLPAAVRDPMRKIPWHS